MPASWGKKMYKKFHVEEAPDWWSKELATWANSQRIYGRASRSPRGTTRAMRTHTPTELQSVASRFVGISFFDGLLVVCRTNYH